MITPVIHIKNPEITLRNCEILIRNDIHNCFLIDHTNNKEELSLRAIRQEYKKDFWVGVNFLLTSFEKELQYIDWEDWDAIWTDYLPETRANIKVPIFGSVGFKYQQYDKDILKQIGLAAKTCDVIVTSGDATGIAPSYEKVQKIKMFSNKSVGIASGINKDNITTYGVDYYMVATSISKDFYNIDEDKLKELIEAYNGLHLC